MTEIATVYTCAVGRYDWVHTPMRPTHGVRFLRFADRRSLRLGAWEHRPLPPKVAGLSPRLQSRWPKIMTHEVLPEADVTIWIDGSVVVLDDLTPLIEQFRRSGADIALFRHQLGRTTEEELDANLRGRRMSARDKAEPQRRRLAEAGLLDRPVPECTIIFRRSRSARLRQAMERWWHELVSFTDRDQVSIAYALQGTGCEVMEWDWHFCDPDCQWFRRLPHRPKGLTHRLWTGEAFLAEYRLEYAMMRTALAPLRRLRRALSVPKSETGRH